MIRTGAGRGPSSTQQEKSPRGATWDEGKKSKHVTALLLPQSLHEDAPRKIMACTNLLVFRDSKHTASLSELCAPLRQVIGPNLASSREGPLDALIAAGRLEAALADRCSSLTAVAEPITDALAKACVESNNVDTFYIRQSLETVAQRGSFTH